MKKIVTVIFLCLVISFAFAHTSVLKSPDGMLQAKIETGEKILFSVTDGQTQVLAPSPLSMILKDGRVWGNNPHLKSKKTRSVNEELTTSFYKKKVLNDNFNELVLNFSGNYSLVFRAYNQGIAYRFMTTDENEIIVENEGVGLNFDRDYMAYVPYVKDSENQTFDQQFFSPFENTYSHLRLSEINPKLLMFLPILIELEDGKKLCITEADLEGYPGLYLNNESGGTSLSGVFAPYPKSTEQGGYYMLQQVVTDREDYIAKTKGVRSFPWRVFAISENDKDLLNNDMVYLLASPSRVSDVSWIKPGKVAWDWWNDWNVYGVDFKSGINNETYKYYIDFASEHHLDYVLLDEGWTETYLADLFKVVPEINIQELVDYGRKKNVGIILWTGYWAIDRDLERVCKTYSEMGVKGFKVDFMNRDDQQMVDFYYRCAATAAKYHLIIDFHGGYKPTGFTRTYPNIMGNEGVFGLEQLKGSSPDMPVYDVTMPYIRMVAGLVDYTQGAMRNASKKNFRPISGEPMSQGTRCHQLAEFVVFESPLGMLCDSPSNYKGEEECTNFIATVPTEWDKTFPLDGKVGEYIIMARERDGAWYVGGLTNWDKRDITVDFSFLDSGNYQIELFRDGINADRAARDYKQETMPLPANKKISVTMMPGGGFAARITKK